MARYGSLLAAAIGGMVGSFARWAAVGAVADDRANLAVFGLNVFGSIMLGALLGRRHRLSDDQFALLGAGFAGGLTTFSTFAVSVARQLEDGALLAAATHGIGTMLTTLIAAGVGYRLTSPGLRALLTRPSRLDGGGASR